ncbi:putative retroelement [Abeliophyllum distichum]|uniref:Retroelement n=1 Tax=Abeliophyllum distichum TaxID=126358 RepID=A0ABD1SC33_9LAMI
MDLGVKRIGSIMPQRNFGKEPLNQQSVHSVIKQFEGQQDTSEIERPSASRYESMIELNPRTMRALLGELTQDGVEQGESHLNPKKMAVDEDPFPQPIDINMVTLNFDKLGLLRFKLLIDNGEDEPRPITFERLKGKAVMHEGVNL